MNNVLVKGGSGFLGSLLARKLLRKANKEKIPDLAKDKDLAKDREYFQTDIRNFYTLDKAAKNCDIIHHNVAQVPMAKDKKLFRIVNARGTEKILKIALSNSINKLIYISDSAIFGITISNNVSGNKRRRPLEAYGNTKYLAEKKCSDFRDKCLNVSMVRPRTNMGLGRLAIFQIFFEWIFQGKNIPVLGSENNIYQFGHAEDLAEMCIKVGEVKENNIFTCGATNFCTMKGTLEDLVCYAGTENKVKMHLAVPLMKISSALKISSLGEYHSLMYGRSMFFDVRSEIKEFSWEQKYSNVDMFHESYDWYTRHRDAILKGKYKYIVHSSKVKQGVLQLCSRLI